MEHVQPRMYSLIAGHIQQQPIQQGLTDRNILARSQQEAA
jgi:hypothetical protein